MERGSQRAHVAVRSGRSGSVHARGSEFSSVKRAERCRRAPPREGRSAARKMSAARSTSKQLLSGCASSSFLASIIAPVLPCRTLMKQRKIYGFITLVSTLSRRRGGPTIKFSPAARLVRPHHVESGRVTAKKQCLFFFSRGGAASEGAGGSPLTARINRACDRVSGRAQPASRRCPPPA